MARARGADGYISVADSNTDLYRIFHTATKPVSFILGGTTEVQPTTGLAASPTVITENAGGLNARTATFECLFPKASPAYGHRGLVTAASHYAAMLHTWTMDIQFQVLPATGFATTPVDNAEWVPGDYSWGGTFVGDVDSTVAVPETNIEAAASFRLKDETTVDTTMAGTIITDGSSHTVQRQGGLQQLSQSYKGDGALTAAGDNMLFNGALAIPDITPVLFTFFSGKTLTQDAFLSRLSINVTRNQITKVSGALQLTGDPTIA